MEACEYDIGDHNNYYVTTAACARGSLSHTLKKNQMNVVLSNPHFALMQIKTVVANSHVGFVEAIANDFTDNDKLCQNKMSGAEVI